MEFQHTLTINRELSDENYLLRLKLYIVEEKATKVEDRCAVI